MIKECVEQRFCQQLVKQSDITITGFAAQSAGAISTLNAALEDSAVFSKLDEEEQRQREAILKRIDDAIARGGGDMMFHREHYEELLLDVRAWVAKS